MLINTIIFYLTATILTISCILTVISKRIMHSVLYSLISFILIGFLYFALNAPFLGAIQISIYGIAMSILFVIAINLTNYKKEEKFKISPRFFLSFIGTYIIFSSILILIKESTKYDKIFAKYINNSFPLISPDSTYYMSYELLQHNLLPFETLGIYLLIALIGISVLLVFKGGR